MANKYFPILDDEWRTVAVPLNVREITTEYDDAVRQLWTIKSKMRDRRALAYLLSEALDQHCHHSYDCCGHWYRDVSTSTLRRVKRNEWVVVVSYNQNV